MPYRVATLLLLLLLTTMSEKVVVAPVAGASVEPEVALLERHAVQLARLKDFTVGDSRGYVFIFSATKDALLELEAAASGMSRVTLLLAYLSPRRTDCSPLPTAYLRPKRVLNSHRHPPGGGSPCHDRAVAAPSST